jgi:ABC-type uncharacterized transport system permease subunit
VQPDDWRYWVSLWPGLLLVTAFSALGNLIWTLVCLTKRTSREWIVTVLLSLFFSALALFVVTAHFPSA